MVDVASLPSIVVGEPPGSDTVDLWCFFHEHVSLEEYSALMTDEERARHRCFRFARDRDAFLATRALVRTALSHYADIAPTDWRFGAAAGGKPYVIGSDLAFNLTNTRGLVACAVGGVGQVGVDAEHMEDRGDLDAIARRYFSPHEAAVIRSPKRFFQIWTLKESYLKARGTGLRLPLDHFWFDVDGIDDDPSIHFETGIPDDPRNWRFASLRAASKHIIAVAADTGRAPLRVRAARTVPLHGIIPF